MKSRGSALVDYVVPTAVIGIIVGVALFALQNNGSLEKFICASGNMKIDPDTQTAIIGQTGPVSDPIATPTAPIQNCSSGLCTIDYGQYILTGIPEDFSTFVQATGSSGGTDTLLSLIDQIANQIDDPTTKKDEGSELKDLSNLGHFISEYESQIETVTNSCKAEADPFQCMSDNFWSGPTPISVGVPAELNHILTDFYTGPTNYGTQANQFLDFGRATRYCSPATSCSSTKSPVHAFNETYYEIMNNTNQTYDPETQAIIKELYEDVVLLGNGLSLMVDNAAGGSASGGGFDPLTGEIISITYPKVGDLKEITNPTTSVGSHLDSKLICATGGTPGTGYTCP